MIRRKEWNDMRAASIEISWNPELSIYASENFLKTVGDEYGWLGGTDNSGKLRCILPYTIIRKTLVRMVRFRVETILMSEDLSIEEEKAFLNSCIEYFRSIGADVVIPATTNTIFRAYPQGAIAAPYGTYIIDLSKPEEQLWNDLHSNHRNKIRIALKKGVEIRSGMEYLNTSYELIRDTFKQSKLGFMDKKAYTQLATGIVENIKIFVATCQDHIQGCLVVPFSKYSAYTLHSGRIPESKTGAMNLLRWEAIRYFHRIGVQRFDSVGIRINPKKGSKQEGLMMFKKRFGGQLKQGYMWKYPINPLKYRVYNLAVKLMRGGDIVDAERHKHDIASSIEKEKT